MLIMENQLWQIPLSARLVSLPVLRQEKPDLQTPEKMSKKDVLQSSQRKNLLTFYCKNWEMSNLMLKELSIF